MKLLDVPTGENSSQRTTTRVQTPSTKATHTRTPRVSGVGFFLTTAAHFRCLLPSAGARGALIRPHSR